MTEYLTVSAPPEYYLLGYDIPTFSKEPIIGFKVNPSGYTTPITPHPSTFTESPVYLYPDGRVDDGVTIYPDATTWYMKAKEEHGILSKQSRELFPPDRIRPDGTTRPTYTT